ncbi:hypothetical protein [Pararhizobium sp.]|uniref:hypothetical protein n=1 Tax=Pararhizobium sp. TaxID=1977563 RepID=UPI0027161301|nr:hypothetical protein [Pararhizobium sp.]MDO9414884.1 hypothetical protein [Pararhizobium sp.]
METPRQQAGSWDAYRLHQLDLTLWESLTTQSGFRFDDFVYHTSDLADLIGEADYVQLVDDCIECEVNSDLRGADFTTLAETLHARLFPRTCQCRAIRPDFPQSIRFHRYAGFTLVHIRPGYSSTVMMPTMELLFHRTPDIDLMRCRDCGDLWVYNLDPEAVEQNWILLDPDYEGKHDPWSRWVNLLSPMEEHLATTYGIISTGSPALRDWQKANNTPESFALYADQ